MDDEGTSNIESVSSVYLFVVYYFFLWWERCAWLIEYGLMSDPKCTQYCTQSRVSVMDEQIPIPNYLN